ncbi:MAG: 50S ribosomal protein L23 [Dissulfurispiraceae bacterium]|jgi:large subunit ribosomal protein L23|nr:50S ribosomal protein L23 [Dissulfurispiraceae bacterium]
MKIIYDVIKKPLFTEKGLDLKEKENKILLQVDIDANKHEIKQAVEEIFKVKVEKVATIHLRGKLKRLGKSVGRRSDKKKAVVTLKQGEKLDLIEGV